MREHIDVRGTEVDVAVVGGGPVGLAAALLLAEAGRETLLVAPEAPGDDRRTAALLGDSIAFLERCGVWPQLEPETAPLAAIHIIDGTRRLVRAPEVEFRASELDRDAFGHNVPNVALVAALKARLEAIGVPWLREPVAAAEAGGDHVTLDLEDGSRIRAAVVVAADGRRSLMRSVAGVTTRTWRYPQSALVCNLAHEAPHLDTSYEIHTENGPLTFVPLPPGEDGHARSSLVWVDRPDRTSARQKADGGDLAREITERSSYLLGAVTVEAGSVQAFPLTGLSVNRFASRRIALAGEAAHVFPPIGAQGLNLGYRDAAAAVAIFGKRAGDPGTASHLEAYHRDRQRDARFRTAAVDALNRTLLAGFLPVQLMRGAGLFALASSRPLRRGAMTLGLGGGRLARVP